MKSIIFVTNISEEMVGESVCGFCLNKVYIGSKDEKEKLNDHMFSWEFALRLFEDSDQATGIIKEDVSGEYFELSKFRRRDIIGDYYLYYFKESTDDNGFFWFEDCVRFIHSMTLSKVSAVSFSHPYSFQLGSGTIIMRSPWSNYYGNDEWPILSLNSKENCEVEKIYSEFQTIQNNWNRIERMIDFWDESRRIINPDIKFVLHVTIMEMFIEGNAELTYRLARSIAVFLGSDEQESTSIYENIKKIYVIRSKYLHEGSEVKTADIQLQTIAQEYARRLIRKLINISAKSKKTLADINETLLKTGFGDYPGLI